MPLPDSVWSGSKFWCSCLFSLSVRLFNRLLLLLCLHLTHRYRPITDTRVHFIMNTHTLLSGVSSVWCHSVMKYSCKSLLCFPSRPVITACCIMHEEALLQVIKLIWSLYLNPPSSAAALKEPLTSLKKQVQQNLISDTLLEAVTRWETTILSYKIPDVCDQK